MSKVLSEAAVAQYERDGYFFPVPVFDGSESADVRARIEAGEAADGGAFKPAHRSKSHLLFKWVDDLIRDARILDPIEDLIGPDILCWNTIFWIKEVGTETFVSWHQDINYWGLEGGEVVSAWLALSPGDGRGGLHASHAGHPRRRGARPRGPLPRRQHADTGSGDLGSSGTRRRPSTCPWRRARCPCTVSAWPMRPGANRSADRRIGLSMHFMPTCARQGAGDWDSAALVRGQDDFGHFHHTPRPTTDFDAEAVRFHEQASAAVREILYRGAEHNTAKL